VSSALYDSIARIARHEVAARVSPAVGVVCDVFANPGATPDHAVSVQLRDTGLVLPRVPVAVGALGFAAKPRIDDMVVVVFLEGDLHAPVVVGRLYDADVTPPEHAEGEVVMRLPPGDSPSWSVVFSESESSLSITNADEVRLELTETTAMLKVGDLEVAVSAAGGGRVDVKAGGQSSIAVKQDGDVSIASATKVKLEAPEIEISATGKLKLSGAMLELN
jgi:phage baseplate assembly protein gpV